MNRDPKVLCAQTGNRSTLTDAESGPAPDGMTVRRAAGRDAAVLADLGARTFAEAFAHLYPPQDLRSFLASEHSVEATAALLADPSCAAWILEENGRAVGYALAGPCALPHPDVTPACGELKRIYVLRERQGGGAGSRLLAEALDWLERDGPRRLWIGVWSENFGAQRLYGRLGFIRTGEYRFKVGETLDREFILRRG
jgi:diamine N-acetyltransferase